LPQDAKSCFGTHVCCSHCSHGSHFGLQRFRFLCVAALTPDASSPRLATTMAAIDPRSAARRLADVPNERARASKRKESIATSID
jgi:hypothetical protein